MVSCFIFIQAGNLPTITKPLLFTHIGSDSDKHSNSKSLSSDSSSLSSHNVENHPIVTRLSDQTSSESICLDPDMCIQVSVQSNSANKADDSLNSSDLIPDTPENVTSSTDRKKFKRSFLSLSTSLLGNRICPEKKPQQRVLTKNRSLEHRLKDRKRVKANSNNDFDNNNGHIDFAFESEVDFENLHVGKRPHGDSSSERKRSDHKLTPKKQTDIFDDDDKFVSNIGVRPKNCSTPLQILQSYKLPSRATHIERKVISLDMENDGALLDVLNELKVDSLTLDKIVESSVDKNVSNDTPATEPRTFDDVDVCSKVVLQQSSSGGCDNFTRIISSRSNERTEAIESLVQQRCDTFPSFNDHDSDLDSVLLELRQNICQASPLVKLPAADAVEDSILAVVENIKVTEIVERNCLVLPSPLPASADKCSEIVRADGNVNTASNELFPLHVICNELAMHHQCTVNE